MYCLCNQERTGRNAPTEQYSPLFCFIIVLALETNNTKLFYYYQSNHKEDSPVTCSIYHNLPFLHFVWLSALWFLFVFIYGPHYCLHKFIFFFILLLLLTLFVMFDLFCKEPFWQLSHLFHYFSLTAAVSSCFCQHWAYYIAPWLCELLYYCYTKCFQSKHFFTQILWYLNLVATSVNFTLGGLNL